MTYYIHFGVYVLVWAAVLVNAVVLVSISGDFKEPYDFWLGLMGGLILVAIFMQEPKKKKAHWYQLHVAFKDKHTHEKVGYMKTKGPFLRKEDVINPRFVRKVLGKIAYEDKRLYGTYMEYTVLAYLGEFDVD